MYTASFWFVKVPCLFLNPGRSQPTILCGRHSHLRSGPGATGAQVKITATWQRSVVLWKHGVKQKRTNQHGCQ